MDLKKVKELVGLMKENDLVEIEIKDGDKKISLADLIVLGGCAAIEEAARKGGKSLTVPFSPGRTACGPAGHFVGHAAGNDLRITP